MTMERFRARWEPDAIWGGEQVVLRDDESGSWTRLRPDQGANLVAFGASIGGQAIETMLQPGDETPSRAPEQYGAPVLFPFPNRLRAGHARFGGREIQIDRPANAPWAIHGLVRNRAWRVDEGGSTAAGASAQLAVEADAETLRQFPFPYRHAIRFTLSGLTLRLDVEATNTGAEPAPIGFGWHPYFRLPLLAGKAREDAIVGVAAARQWVLDSTLLPTGEVVAAPSERDFRTPRALGPTFLDDVYTGVLLEGGESICRLGSDVSGPSLTVAAGPTFRDWVVYAPPTRPTICFEPYTCPTDAFNLAERGIDVGVIVLRPGETWSDWIELRLSL
jgi:aldose 1-epimerase